MKLKLALSLSLVFAGDALAERPNVLFVISDELSRLQPLGTRQITLHRSAPDGQIYGCRSSFARSS